ncbi:HDR057Wp [Eremothecium sinecaudum]|uniref:HDR057Wp n=1 Tax=Eremothecium sinecaudum TaxID=45286 RepID=A0A0X8HSU2_9SACH|nr:HDR057Wp [Eremothecium sinecaudum]AMD20799.1 HDR057Wp [Eremothecium sinecaudum]
MDLIESITFQPPLWSIEQERIIKLPYEHLASNPGKNIRNKLIHVFNKFYKLDEDKVNKISQLLEILHISSLLIDDIEDDSPYRRGRPSAHVLYGTPMTINAANYMYFVSMLHLQQLSENEESATLTKLLVIFNEEMVNLHRGQGLDIYWRDNFVIPNEQDYFQMVMNKTGGLFRLAVRIMECLQSNYDKTLVPFSNLLGVLYQVRDDYMNLKDPQMIQSKGFASDITEGKFSYPLIHALHYAKAQDPEGFEFLTSTLKMRSPDDDVKNKVVDYLENVSLSIQHTKKWLEEFTDSIKEKYMPGDDKELFNIIESLGSL